MNARVFVMVLLLYFLLGTGDVDAQGRRDRGNPQVTPTPPMSTVTPMPSITTSPTPTEQPDEDEEEEEVTPTPRPQRPTITPTPTRPRDEVEERRGHERNPQRDARNEKEDERDDAVLPANTAKDDTKPTPSPIPPTPTDRPSGVSGQVNQVYRSVVKEPLSLLERSLPREFYLNEQLSPRGNAVLLTLAVLSSLFGYLLLRGPLVMQQGLRDRIQRRSLLDRRSHRSSSWIVDGHNRM